MNFTSEKDLGFFDNLSDLIVIIDEECKIQYVNNQFKKLMSYKELLDFKGEDIREFLSIIDDERNFSYSKICSWENFNNCHIRIRCLEEIEFRLTSSNIKIKDYNYIILSIIQEDSNINYDNYILSRKIDIKSKEIENENNNYGILGGLSYKALNTILYTSPNGIIVQNKDKVIFNNKASKEIVCGNLELNMIGKNIFDLVNFENTVCVNNEIDKELLKDESNLSLVQRKVRRQDGTIIYLEMSTMCFMEDNEIYTVFIFKDITKRIKAEYSLKRSTDDYSRLLHFLPFGVAVYDNLDDVIFVNETMLKTLGMESKEQLNRTSMEEIVHKDYLEDMYEIYKAIMNDESKIEHREIVFKKDDGTFIEADVGAINIYFAGKKSILLIMNDLTDIKKARIDKIKLDQTIQYDKMKTEFIANVSHELKTPLNIILSIVQLIQLKSEKNSEEYETIDRYIDILKQNCYRLLRLINNLIDMTRIEGGNLKMNFENYDIVQIVEDITLSTVEYVENRGMYLIFDTDIEEKVLGIDKENIERVMLNLLSNAVKFSKENGEIVVSIHEVDDAVEIHVKDNGIGIPEDMIDIIFNRFVQGESLFTRAHEGSGIGLSLVKSILEAHGGSIKVYSKVDEGSEFVVVLPNKTSKKQTCSLVQEDKLKKGDEKIKIEFSDIA